MPHNLLKLAMSLTLPYLIVVGMVVKAILPLVTGRPVLLAIEPVDPRDLMRGQYVELSYDFTMLDLEKFSHALTPGREYRFGDRLYLVLRQADGSILAKPLHLQENKPAEGIFIKVMPRYGFSIPPEKNAVKPTVHLKAGIEAFYADELMVPELEAQARAGKLAARVFIAPGGEARLAGIEGRPGTQSERIRSPNAQRPSASP